MPVEILAQLKTLRQNIADQLQQDPRFLTLASLDKSIVEITQVLVSAGALPAGASPAPAPLAGLAPTSPPAAAAAAAAPPPATRSILKPALAAGAALGAGAAVAAVAVGSAHAAEAPGAEEAEADDDKEDDPAGQREAAADVEEPEAPQFPAAAAALLGAAPGGSRAGGYTPMAARPDAPAYKPSASIRIARLPPTVDLRPYLTPVEDQGQTNSCVANAVAGAYEYWIKKVTRQDANVSRLFVYYNARWRDGSQDRDEGSVIQFAMETLQKFGACAEHAWPFEKQLVLHKPGAEAYQLASDNRVHDMAKVPLELEAWKQALAEGKPIVFGCALFDTFDEASERGGVVPMPAPDAVGRGAHGRHAMCAVGYSDRERVFIVRNSWGANWGDGGYCYMPYDYLLNPAFNADDNWVFDPRTPMPLPRETWSTEPRIVTNGGRGVSFDISPYSIASYAALALDLFSDTRRPFNTTLLSDYSEYVSWSATSEWSMMESADVDTLLAESEETFEEEYAEESVDSDEALLDDDSAEADLEETESAEETEEGDAEVAEAAALLEEPAEEPEAEELAEPQAFEEELAEEEPSETEPAEEEMAEEELAEEEPEPEPEEEPVEDEPEPEPEPEEEPEPVDDGGGEEEA